MFIAIVGTRLSGKSTVVEYLVKSQGFIPVQLSPEYDDAASVSERDRVGRNTVSQSYRPVSFLLMNSPVTPSFPQSVGRNFASRTQELMFSSSSKLLDHVTRNWRSNFITLDLNTRELLEQFLTRPFFMVVCVDAPLFMRFQRSKLSNYGRASLEEFVRENDYFFYGLDVSGSSAPQAQNESSKSPSLKSLHKLVNLHVMNSFDTIPELYSYLNELDIVNPERLRPSWDTYFMQLASLASLRSNCMKRRVGAILVRHNRILATGYNGTPRGLTNCNEGGCGRCNSAAETSDECVCLHAEENALLEAGRERVGDGSVIYCNTCPCLKCTIKIIQTGVKEVVYNLSYKVDDASAALFKEAGVKLRRHAPPPDR